MYEKTTDGDLYKEYKCNTKSGRLKVFFGYAAGVGKTYAMLDAAHSAKKNGVDVVAGYIQPQNRPETSALVEGLETLPLLNIEYKGRVFNEFNLDEALKRNPHLILVDELAHTNPIGCRHKKRYSDIEELLRAGIDVYTTVNVQHLESLNDVVEAITNIKVSERIPDRIFDNANQVKLVDIEPDDLIERLNQGKVYNKEQASRALDNFFTRENLASLREIALRRTADRVKNLEEEKKFYGNRDHFTGEHILLCLSSSPSNEKVIRAAARLGAAFHGSLTAIYVETFDAAALPPESKKQLRKNLKIARDLGAKIVTVYGEDIPYQISKYAKASGVSKIVMGRSNTKGNFIGKKINFVERLINQAPSIDIYIIPDNLPKYEGKNRKLRLPKFEVGDIAKSIGILLICTLIGLGFYEYGFTEGNIISIYILGILGISMTTSSKVYGILSSTMGVLIFTFLFAEPRFRLKAYDASYPVTFVIMFAVSILTSTLSARIKKQAEMSAMKSHRMEVLLETNKKLQKARSIMDIIENISSQIIKLLGRDVVIYPVKDKDLQDVIVYRAENSKTVEESYCTQDERAVATWVFKNIQSAGASTDTLPGSKGLYVPLYADKDVFAVIGIVMEGYEEIDPFEKSLLNAMLSESASAMERYHLNEAQKQIALKAQRESLRSNLLRAISHDLRTPLTCISGNANVLMGSGENMDEKIKQTLYEDIYDDSLWLINLVENLLSVTRIENGSMDIEMQPEFWEEVITEALKHVNRKKSSHNIIVEVEDEMLMSKMHPRLIIQVIINIVDNGIKYTDEGSTITISARRDKGRVAFEVADNGSGISQKDKERLFDMFFTLDKNKGDSRRGLGLGLSLCKSIINAHEGDIYVRDNIPRGTIFGFKLPLEEVLLNENTDFSS